ncbi:hypothetical protein HW555_011044, partial [Spodoptera exigua]
MSHHWNCGKMEVPRCVAYTSNQQFLIDDYIFQLSHTRDFLEYDIIFSNLDSLRIVGRSRNDRLPKKVCDKCSCKVNDFYQFCNETIEVQNRLHSLFLPSEAGNDGSVDLTLVKDSRSPPPPALAEHCERSTQTDNTDASSDCNACIQVKEEPTPVPPSPVKQEEDDYYNVESDPYGGGSSGSEDISLIKLKTKETSQKRGRKKKSNEIKDWGELMNYLPEGALAVVSKEQVDMPLASIKEELLTEKDQQGKDGDLYNCCICFTRSFSRSEMLKHYNECKRVQVVSRAEWGKHWLRHWERDRRPYRCSLCEKTFRDPYQILKHGKTHNYEEGASSEPVNKRFLCDQCPEAFVHMRHINSLRRHLRSHTGERNFLCNVCGKALSSRDHLKFHIRIHTGYKPNVCKYVPQRGAALRVCAVRPRVRGQGAAVHASQVHLHIARAPICCAVCAAILRPIPMTT